MPWLFNVRAATAWIAGPLMPHAAASGPMPSNTTRNAGLPCPRTTPVDRRIAIATPILTRQSSHGQFEKGSGPFFQKRVLTPFSAGGDVALAAHDQLHGGGQPGDGACLRDVAARAG